MTRKSTQLPQLCALAVVFEGLPNPVARVKPPIVKNDAIGPFDLPGTYVVVLRVEEAGVAHFARLGTFWFPAGYLLYVGSAFGVAGVAGRTARHIAGTGHRLWGVDDLRGFAKPVELWWTHHAERVECTWAMALAHTPECCCTAPLAGASDCKRCPAHLYFTKDRPSAEGFAQRLGARGSGGYTVNCQPAPRALAGAIGANVAPNLGKSDPFNPLG